jgi:hypothetical protein
MKYFIELDSSAVQSYNNRDVHGKKKKLGKELGALKVMYKYSKAHSSACYVKIRV